MKARTRLLAATGALLLATAVAACAGKTTPSTSLGNASGQPGVGNVPDTSPRPGSPTSRGATPPAPRPSRSASAGSPPPVLPPEDCHDYDPAALAIVDDGPNGFIIQTGLKPLFSVDTASDADTAVALLRNYSQECFIGRGNGYSGDNRYMYITSYWQGSGAPGASVPTNDCFDYDNTKLSFTDEGPDGFRVVSETLALAAAPSVADANAVVALAAAHHKICYIGRRNTRPDHYRYVFEYWI